MNKEVKEKFDIKVQEVYKRLEDLGYKKDKILGVFLYGSQNYDLHTETSDFDFKVIILPTFSDFLHHRSTAKTYRLNDVDEDQIEVKDIRTMTEMWRKGNPAYLEILDTPYYHTNFKGAIDRLKSMNPATINPLGTVNAIYGMATQKQKALTHPYPSKVDVIEKYGYDAKQLSHIIRLFNILTYANDELKKGNANFNINDYALNMDEKTKKHVKDLKLWKLSLSDAEKLSNEGVEKMKEIKDNMLKQKSRETQALQFNTDIWNEIMEWVEHLIKDSIKKDIIEE